MKRLAAVAALALLAGCAAVAPAVAAPEAADSSETQLAVEDLRLRVEQYGVSAIVPRGWQYQRFDQAVLAQAPSRAAGLIVFGAQDLNEMQTTLIKLGTTLSLLTGEQSGDEREQLIHNARFVVVAYPQSKIASRGADVRIGVAHLRGDTLLTFVSYGLAGEKEEAERLRVATESILIE